MRDNNIISILDVLLTETTLATKANPGSVRILDWSNLGHHTATVRPVLQYVLASNNPPINPLRPSSKTRQMKFSSHNIRRQSYTTVASRRCHIGRKDYLRFRLTGHVVNETGCASDVADSSRRYYVRIIST